MGQHGVNSLKILGSVILAYAKFDTSGSVTCKSYKFGEYIFIENGKRIFLSKSKCKVNPLQIVYLDADKLEAEMSC